MAELVGGAAVGAIFGELLKAVLEMKDKAIVFKQILSNLQSTLEAITPVIKEIEQHNNDLGRPKEELERLIRQMEDGMKLVSKCSKIHRLNYFARIRNQEQLLELLIYFKFIEMQTQTARDQKETLLTVRRILSKVNKLPYGSSEDTRRSDSDLDVSDSESFYSAVTQLSENSAGFSRTNSTEQFLEDITSLTLTQEGSQSEANAENNQATEHLMNEKSYDQLFTAEKRILGIRLPKIKPILPNIGGFNSQVKKATLEAPTVYCAACGTGIEKKDTLYTKGADMLSHSYCNKCYDKGIPGNIIALKGCPYKFGLGDIMRASTEVFEEGVYGTTYKAILKGGTTLLVKSLKEVHVRKEEFERQVEIMQKLSRHPNVMPLLAYYYSKGDILLIYDCKTADRFSSLLHGRRKRGRTPLDWDSRLKIALGAARGIAHIHSQSPRGGKMVHDSVTSSNVLVTSDLQGCIFDSGLTSLAHFSVSSGNGSCKNDVFNFGVLLFEMLTGTDNDPVRHCFAHEIYVEYDLLFGRRFYDRMLDDELQKDREGNRDAMAQILQLAMACVEEENSPWDTISMDEIVEIIENISARGYSTIGIPGIRVVIIENKGYFSGYYTKGSFSGQHRIRTNMIRK